MNAVLLCARYPRTVVSVELTVPASRDSASRDIFLEDMSQHSGQILSGSEKLRFRQAILVSFEG